MPEIFVDKFFKSLKDKIIEVKQKDGFCKIGYLRYWDNKFLYIEFLDTKTINAIALDAIIHIKERRVSNKC